MDELAWAGGFFDAEGSTVVLVQRRWMRLRVQVPQKDPTGTDELLRRFAAAVGAGRIASRSDGISAFYTPRTGEAIAVLMRLFRWIGDVKREQALVAARRMLLYLSATSKPIGPRSVVRRGNRDGLAALLRVPAGSAMTPQQELAWAAGLFDGDGSFGCPRSRTNPHRVLTAKVSQSGDDGVPLVLDHLRRVLRCGRIVGPGRPRHARAMSEYEWVCTVNREVRAISEALRLHRHRDVPTHSAHLGRIFREP